MIEYANATEAANVIDADLAKRRGAPLGETRDRLEQPLLAEQLVVVPSAIEVVYWSENDGSWSAHCELLGVSAVADREEDIFGATAGAVEEFWDILNSRYASLSDDLRNLLAARYQNLLFRKRD